MTRLDVAREAAARAGRELIETFWEAHDVKRKGRYDLSLSSDRTAGEMIRSVIADAYGDEAILEEDADAPSSNSDYLWIVDPLDGTVNYYHRLPWYCVSIACYRRTQESSDPWGTPVAAVVYAPSLNVEFYVGEHGSAYANGRPLRVSGEALSESLVSMSRGSTPDDQEAMASFLRVVGPHARKTRSHGAAALDLAFVAQGSLGAHVQRSLRPWDVAAGIPLVRAAGGRVTLRGDDSALHVLASNAVVHDELAREFG